MAISFGRGRKAVPGTWQNLSFPQTCFRRCSPAIGFLASVRSAPVPSNSVEHSCYQCGAGVEDGIPFCRQCNAPQIRVATAEAIGPAETVPDSFSRPRSAALPFATFAWPHALRAAALAGLFGVILVVMLRQAFALAMITSGVLSVYFYRRKNPFSNLTAWTGALLGGLSGVFGTILLAVPSTFMLFSIRSGGEARTAIMAAVQEQVAHNPDPHARELLEYLNTPQGFTFMMIIFLIVMLIFFLVLSSLGGALAAAVLRRRQRS